MRALARQRTAQLCAGFHSVLLLKAAYRREKSFPPRNRSPTLQFVETAEALVIGYDRHQDSQESSGRGK